MFSLSRVPTLQASRAQLRWRLFSHAFLAKAEAGVGANGRYGLLPGEAGRKRCRWEEEIVSRYTGPASIYAPLKAFFASQGCWRAGCLECPDIVE